MTERTCLCRQCRNVFKLPVSDSATPEKEELKCPACGSPDVEDVPAWAPIGFTEGSPTWEYECQQCQHVFRRPVPDSPAQEKAIKCPECGGGHIHRLTPTGGAPLYCG